MIRYIPIQVHDDGVHCGECERLFKHLAFCALFKMSLFVEVGMTTHGAAYQIYERCPQCLAQAKEIVPDAELTALRAQVEALRRALHEVAEEWAGSECGVPVHAQEAYAIGLAKRMYELAVEAMKGQS